MRKPLRPVDSGILHARFPAGAWASILHRVSGVILVLLFPFALYVFARSLTPEGFNDATARLEPLAARVALILGVWLFAHHFFAGVRHLLLDLEIGIGRTGGRAGAMSVFVAGAVVTVWAAVAWL